MQDTGAHRQSDGKSQQSVPEAAKGEKVKMVKELRNSVGPVPGSLPADNLLSCRLVVVSGHSNHGTKAEWE